MTNKHRYEVSPSQDWLREMADAEGQCESISAAGLAADLGILQVETPVSSRIFGRFIHLARRAKGLTIESLAESADVDIAQLLAIENEGVTPVPRTLYRLAQTLQYSTGRLMELAGLAEPKDPEFKEAAIRFAARSEPAAKLTEEERQAFEEFVRVLVENSD